MRKIVLALAAIAAVGFSLPVVSAPAEAKKVVIIKKSHHAHGRHYGWTRGHHYGWRNKHMHHGHRHGATVVVR
jgi:hypothetical protein